MNDTEIGLELAMKIFQKVHCKGYLEKFSDGVCLMCEQNNTLTEANHWDEPITVKAMKFDSEKGKTEEIADLSEFCGECVTKQYRRRIEAEFDGFLVGVTNVITSGKIGTDFDCHPYYGDIYHLTKETKKEKVGVVYFKNNAKRYVLLDDIFEGER